MGKRSTRGRNFPGPKRNSMKDKDPGNQFLRDKLSAISGGDHTLAENPIDALYAREIITERQREAARAYAALRGSRFKGKHFPEVLNWAALVAPSVDGEAFPDRSWDVPPEEKAGRIREAYERADAVLRSAGTRAHSAVQNIACFGRWPAVFGMSSPGRIESCDRDVEALKVGLTALADHWRIQERRKEAA